MSILWNGAKAFLGSKPIVALVIALLVFAGGAYAYHAIVVSKLEAENANLRTDLNTAIANTEKAVSANLSLQGDVIRLKYQSEQILRQVNELQEKDREVATWFEEAKATLINGGELSRRLAEDPEGTIKLINDEIACLITNIGKRTLCATENSR